MTLFRKEIGTWKRRLLIKIKDCVRSMEATKKGSVVLGWFGAMILPPAANGDF